MQTALVTGGAVRVGRALSLALAEYGARVVVHYHSSGDDAAEVTGRVRRGGGEAVAIQADLGRPEEVVRLAAEAEAAFGGVDILINNAAVFPAASLAETDVDLWDSTLAVNLRAPFLLTRELAPKMRSRGSGIIINVADLAGLEPWTGYAAHSIAKAGLIHLTQISAKDFAPEVRVAAIAPGTVLPPENTAPGELRKLAERAPLGRIGSPDDVVRAMLYLIQARFVTGQTMIVDGGRTVGRL